MRQQTPMIPATLIKRYKRFLADVSLENGIELTVHTPNTGSMLGCAEPGMRVWLRDTRNLERKYRYSWEMSETFGGTLVGIHTGISNALVKEAIESGVVTELQGYAHIRSEVKYGQENSRIDLLLESDLRPDCYVEVKNVTAVDDSGMAMFPDAVSVRGSKHLRELMHMVRSGQRAVIFYCVQRNDVRELRPADEIDSVYGQTLREALAVGVEALAYRADVSPQEVSLVHSMPIMT